MGVGPWWLEYKHNADIKITYASSAAFTIGLHSTPLASSTTFLTVRESTAISNSSNKYLDYSVAGKVTTGTSPTVDKEIRVYAYKAIDDTPTYPDVFDGTDSDETISLAAILDQFPRLGATTVTATSNLAYWFPNLLTIAQAFGFVPKDWGIFVAHNTGVALHATAGNHAFNYVGMYNTATG